MEADRAQKMPKVAKVKNKTPAEVQITAEQLLREAKERELEIVPPPPKQKISDPEELAEYRLKKRKGFEDNIRKNRGVISNWLKYAAWEESQKEIQRARSVYERALDVDSRNVTVWLKYAEMEMKNKQVQHARNIWDRAVSILPRVNQFWYKYTFMEETLGNVPGCRQIFQRWMEWQPDEQAWLTYIKFEMRYKEVDEARKIYEQFIIVHPEVKNWIRYSRFEEQNGLVDKARDVFERAIVFFGDEFMSEDLFLAFARFEEKQREHERVRVIFRYALDRLPKENTENLYKAHCTHEKKFGTKNAIENVIFSKRKLKYEKQIEEDPFDYYTWFDYIRLMEANEQFDIEGIRDVYERAIANIPQSGVKRDWRIYIYLWIYYAVFEELVADDIERTRAVYRGALSSIPHKAFTFSKVWIMAAQFEVRQKDMTAARKIMGTAIGMCPRTKLFRSYLELEIELREFDRCRILYQKFLAFQPENCTTWVKFAELESILGDTERARHIFEIAINQPQLDMPEVVWKSYIDFEVEQDNHDAAKELYERLLERTSHVKVWISYGRFMGARFGKAAAREVFDKGEKMLREQTKEERCMLIEAWYAFEQEQGDVDWLAKVKKMLPQKIKKRRKVEMEDGGEGVWEEYYDYVFETDQEARPHLKLLQMARAWKKQEEKAE
ncbi:crooked neck-like protein 1 [Varroa jacobsoni]|uniref:Pre-mRNA-splicing factor Syf1/CRNKL1-like C-terminal HAT-repeats domain-containing protein n=1 Tax=Varroa destructor TaxID=109461 RepID=A0A7M7JME4_VARDE|nr:crooked neck-like protein 1 [Varroa destructor]XP_022708461.1 crooked neck-like protein 1 [Varroa jacobsoni]